MKQFTSQYVAEFSTLKCETLYDSLECPQFNHELDSKPNSRRYFDAHSSPDMTNHAHSFDIYDTLLVRTVFTPEGIFLLVGEELKRRDLWKDTPQEWMHLRRAAEATARGAQSGEIRLDDIRRELCRTLESSLVDTALEIELHVELQSSVGISATLERVRNLADAKEPVCYISDMYLSSAHISRSLQAIGAPALPLYTSSESGKTKREGALFDEVASTFGETRVHLRHLGDNLTADVNVPRKRGFTAEHFLASRPTILERHIHDKIATTDSVAASVIAGSLKAARLSPPPALTEMGHARWLHTTQAGAVLQLGFVSWIVEQVRELSPDRIFFLARDGYVPWKLYEQFRQMDDSLPPSTYLYVSRQSLHAASIEGTIEAEDRQWILAKTDQLTFAEWLFRMELRFDADFSAEEIQVLRLPAADKRLDPIDFELCKSLIDHPLFQKKILERAAEKRATVLTYLDQQGLTKATHPCFIDIGWHGRMQRALVKLARPASKWRTISGLYFGLIKHQPAEYGDYRAWLFDRTQGRRANVDHHLDLYEILFSAPHATTFGYEREPGNANGEIRPLLADWDPLRPSWQDIALGLSALERIQEWIHKRLDNSRVNHSLSLVAVDAAYQWLHFPNEHQALAYSSLEFGSDQINLGKERLIYPLSDWQCIAIMLRCRRRDGTNQWFNGQLVSARSPLARALISIYRFVKVVAARRRGEGDQLALVRVWPSDL